MAIAAHTVLIDDVKVVVNRFDFEAGDETGHHVHQMAYVIVPLSDGTVRVVDDAGSETLAEMQMGVPYSRPRGVSHNVINALKTPLSFLEIEIKP
ncbi:MAG: quercetin dioxygenase-like cupin family protein [Pseudorhodobacter sp.]|jgi:quercetin dioxygenase-like cupin family protein